jgi:hypothetical protein
VFVLAVVTAVAGLVVRARTLTRWLRASLLALAILVLISAAILGFVAILGSDL